MRIIKKFFCFVISATVCLSLISTSVSAACDMSSYWTDGTSGWALKTSKLHRGSVVTDYKYVNSEIKNRYSSNMNAAIAMWGSHINMCETSTSGYGTISVKNDSSDGALATAYTSGVLNGHSDDNFTIEINQAHFDNESSTIKKIVLAHEIGHVYGLAHYKDTSKIMNPEALSTMSISVSEFAGLDTCTHKHSHTTYTYERFDGADHKKRCSYCKAYTLERHTFNSNNICTKCGRAKASTTGLFDYEDNNGQDNINVWLESVSPDEDNFENEMPNSYDTSFIPDGN